MKRTFLFVAAVCMTAVAGAQNYDSFLGKIEKAKANTQNEKKADKPATWMALGKAYIEGYSAVKGGDWKIIMDAPQMQVKMLITDVVESSETMRVNGTEFLVDHYAGRDYYYGEGGSLAIIKVTKPLMKEDPLALAYESYMHAAQLDAAGSKTREIVSALNTIREAYFYDARSEYFLGKTEDAGQLFEKAVNTFENDLVKEKDSLSAYYAALSFNAAGDKENATKYYEKCYEWGYYSNGDVISGLADIYKNAGKVEEAKEILNKGFTAYPSSQAILISLINLYNETKDDPAKVLDLIHTAQANEPNNASLFYAEGNIHKEMGDEANAEACYNKCAQIDPTYIFGFMGIGDMYYQKAVNVQQQMDELDINDVAGYEKLLEERDADLVKSIDPYENMFKSSTEREVKDYAAQNLKNIYYVLRSKDSKYQEGYDRIAEYLNQ